MEREFANFAYDGLRAFDYGPYETAMRAASRPAVVDRAPPMLSLAEPRASAEQNDAVDLHGTAEDNLAVRAVHWRTDAGLEGVAEMTWTVESGSPADGWQWRMDWIAKDVLLHGGQNTIVVTVEDIKGLTTDETVSIRR
jgi:hypothetical protein